MMDAKTINVLLEGHFKLSRHKNRRLKMRSSHVKGVICISCEQFNVCYSLYEVRITQVVRVVSRYMSNPRQEQWRAIK